MRKFFDSIDTILTILEALEDSEEAHSVRKIEELTGVPKSTVHRILQELTAIGLSVMVIASAIITRSFSIFHMDSIPCLITSSLSKG